MLPTESLLCDAEGFEQLIARLAREVADASRAGVPLRLVGVRTRGVPIAERLAERLREDLEIDCLVGAVDITLYRDDLGRGDHWPLLKGTEIPFDIDGTDVVLVDDVLFTGRTIRAAMNGVCDLGRPSRIRLAVVVDRGGRELPIRADHVGIALPTDRDERVMVRIRPIDAADEVVRSGPVGKSLIPANKEARHAHPSGPTEIASPMPPAKSAPAASWTRRHLLDLESLSREEILLLLDTAEEMDKVSKRDRKKVPALTGRIVFNLFFENSTRTRTSFSLAAKRLSADVQDFSASVSSLSKGETFIDTARNIEAMGADVLVVRHPTPGAPHLLSQHVKASIINAGDGAHEHPTQGLLDLMTIRRAKGKIEGLTVGLIGDISHSRVARSNIWGLTKLGARVILCGPPTLVPRSMERLGCEVVNNLDAILPQLDVVNVLRIQFERDQKNVFPSIAEYFRLYGMTRERMERGKGDMLLLAPGPINRGVELTPEVADGPRSAILDQVTNGLAVRMAALYLVCGRGA